MYKLLYRFQTIPHRHHYMTREINNFLTEYESRVVELSQATNEACFNASVAGKPEDYRRASELKLQLGRVCPVIILLKMYSERNYRPGTSQRSS